MPTRRDALAALAAAPLTRPALAHAADPPPVAVAPFTADVTVPIGHPLMGGGVAPAKEVIDPLQACGFVLIGGGGKPVVVVAVDWCEIRNGAYDLFRRKLADAVGTDPVRVLLSSVHQHDAPVADVDAQRLLDEHKAGASVCDVAFVEKAAARVADAARAALPAARRVTHVGTGKASVDRVASNRRYVAADGTVRHDRMSRTRDPVVRAADEGTVDPLLRTLTLWDGDAPLVAVSGYATHPMSYYGRGGVTADFVGMARRRRQADTPGCLQVYVSGCSGNVTAGKYNDGDPSNRPALADRVYKAMAAAWADTKRHPLPAVGFRSTPLTLEPRKSAGFAADELRKRLTADPRPFGRCLAALGLSWRQRADAGIPIDVPVVELGPARLLLLPAEAYVEYQLLAQKLLPDRFVLTAGYGECGPGYIPVERAWREKDANLADWCWIAEGSEQRMTEAITRLLGR